MLRWVFCVVWNVILINNNKTIRGFCEDKIKHLQNPAFCALHCFDASTIDVIRETEAPSYTTLIKSKDRCPY